MLAQTVEIERAVFRIEDERIVAQPAVKQDSKKNRSRRTTISEQAFYQALDDNGHLSGELRSLLSVTDDMGLELEPGENSLKLKYYVEDRAFNFIVFGTNNTIRNFGIAGATRDIGHPAIGLSYLDDLAALFKTGYVRKGRSGPFHWTVRLRNGDYISISDFLSVRDQWLELVNNTIKKIDSVLLE